MEGNRFRRMMECSDAEIRIRASNDRVLPGDPLFSKDETKEELKDAIAHRRANEPSYLAELLGISDPRILSLVAILMRSLEEKNRQHRNLQRMIKLLEQDLDALRQAVEHLKNVYSKVPPPI